MNTTIHVKETILFGDGSKVFEIDFSMAGMDEPIEISLNARDWVEANNAAIELKHFMDKHSTDITKII